MSVTISKDPKIRKFEIKIGMLVRNTNSNVIALVLTQPDVTVYSSTFKAVTFDSKLQSVYVEWNVITCEPFDGEVLIKN